MSEPTNSEILAAVQELGGRMDGVEKRLDRIEERLDTYEEYFAALALGQAQINKRIDDLKNDSVPT